MLKITSMTDSINYNQLSKIKHMAVRLNEL